MKGIDLLRLAAILAIALGATTGCSGSDGAGETALQDLPPAAQPMSAEVQGFVDQGNVAQRDGLYEEALGYYREAMDLDPAHPIPQFGALMAATSLGNTALAATLSEQLQTTAPELLEMMNPGGGMGASMGDDPHAGMGGMGATMPGMTQGGDTIGGLPSGHPTLIDVGPADTTQPDTAGGR